MFCKKKRPFVQYAQKDLKTPYIALCNVANTRFCGWNVDETTFFGYNNIRKRKNKFKRVKKCIVI